MSFVDDLRELSKLLPPNVAVSASEALPVLSALIQVAEHGSELVDAAKQGSQAVADYYHEKVSAQAREAGNDEPRRGAPAQATAPAGAPAPAAAPAGGSVTPEQFAELIKQVQSLSAAIGNENRPTASDVTITPAPAVVTEGTDQGQDPTPEPPAHHFPFGGFGHS